MIQQLAHATQQNNYQHLFNNIPVYDGSDKDNFFHWLDKLHGTCLMSGHECQTEAFAKSMGKVKNTLASIDFDTPWSVVQMVLIKEFSHLTSPAHACAYLNSLQQKTTETLKIYNYRYSYHNLVAGIKAKDKKTLSRWMKYLPSIRNTVVADRISKSSKLPNNLEDCMARAIRIESVHKLAEGINKTQILPSITEGDKVNKVTVEDIGNPHVRSSNCFGCGQVGHFYEDCMNPKENIRENHPFPQNKGPDVNWNLSMGIDGTTNGLFAQF